MVMRAHSCFGASMRCTRCHMQCPSCVLGARAPWEYARAGVAVLSVPRALAARVGARTCAMVLL
eukprot:1785171-Alexandrium_andersonii.AAC.2